MRKSSIALGMLVLSLAVQPGSSLAEPGVPAWVKGIFTLYAEGVITDATLLTALEYLIENGIIQVTAARPAETVREKIPDEGDFGVTLMPNPNSPYPPGMTVRDWLEDAELLEIETCLLYTSDAADE